MKRMIRMGSALGTALVLSTIAMAAGSDESRVLFDFTNADSASRWRSVNDGVMGGVSEGRFRLSDEGVMLFSGNLSLENNGGFASVRSVPAELGLKPGEVVVLRLKGDGRPYALNLYTPVRRTAYSHRAEFPTTEGKWIEVRIPILVCEAQSYGRAVPEDGPIDAEQISSIGITLSDKKPGPFQLEIDSIGVAEGDGANEVTVTPVKADEGR